ncbi:MAG: hypothetical protein JWR38_3468 [Mucilaginibacter sp.]|nr:hypothetical protein [Mucilaginibacter sp.]
MEFDENKNEEIEDKYTDDDYVDIYSKRAILGFSTIFGVIFGGVLLMLNLKAAGYKKEIGQVLIFCIFYHFLSAFLLSSTGIKINPATLKAGAAGAQLSFEELKPSLLLFAITLVINVIGGLVLTKYFFKKYFPDEDYYPKPIWTPLLVSILIALAASYILRIG